MRSETLKRYFEENPNELSHLRHDGELGTKMRQQAHLKHVPDYLLPRDGKNALTESQVGFVPFRKHDDGKKQKGKKGAKGGKGGHGKYKKGPGGRKNVLKTFRVRK